MRLSELLKREVVDESGKRLGRVREVRGALAGERLVVNGLVVATPGFLERYGIGTHGSGGPETAKVRGYPAIAWERVVRISGNVLVRD